MSHVLSACVIDAELLRKLAGSGDEALVQQVIQANPDAFDDDPQDDKASLAPALRHIVMGDPQDGGEAQPCGYALQELCAHVGETIEPDAWSGVRWEAVEACGLDDLLTQTGPPIALPESDDPPMIGHLGRGELDAALAAARKRLAKVVDDEIEDLLDEYIDWLEAARTAKLDVVFFYH